MGPWDCLGVEGDGGNSRERHIVETIIDKMRNSGVQEGCESEREWRNMKGEMERLRGKNEKRLLMGVLTT